MMAEPGRHGLGVFVLDPERARQTRTLQTELGMRGKCERSVGAAVLPRVEASREATGVGVHDRPRVLPRGPVDRRSIGRVDPDLVALTAKRETRVLDPIRPRNQKVARAVGGMGVAIFRR